MILLDTNVVSALMAQDPAATTWLDHQPLESIWLTAVGVFETRLGIELLAQGRKRSALEGAFHLFLTEGLSGRVAAFDVPAARAAAALAAERRKLGRPVDVRDTQIAGIAIARRATIATRNTRHFQDLPTPVVDPWA
jgi:hypothetical protein